MNLFRYITSRTLTFKSSVVPICTRGITFNNSTFCPHRVFMCFVWIWEQTAIISLYSTNRLVFITEMECVHCAVRTGYIILYTYITLHIPLVTICTTSLTFSNSSFCTHSVCMCFVWIWEQTVIISQYNTNWPVFITETECVYCTVRTGSLNIGVNIGRFNIAERQNLDTPSGAQNPSVLRVFMFLHCGAPQQTT
jgi:hypothetical protein